MAKHSVVSHIMSAIGHETDMPHWSLYVRSWGQSGKHMLALSFSGFDPKPTSLHVCGFGDRAAFHDRRAEPSLIPRHARRQGHRLCFEAPGRAGRLCVAGGEQGKCHANGRALS